MWHLGIKHEATWVVCQKTCAFNKLKDRKKITVIEVSTGHCHEYASIEDLNNDYLAGFFTGKIVFGFEIRARVTNATGIHVSQVKNATDLLIADGEFQSDNPTLWKKHVDHVNEIGNVQGGTIVVNDLLQMPTLMQAYNILNEVALIGNHVEMLSEVSAVPNFWRIPFIGDVFHGGTCLASWNKTQDFVLRYGRRCYALPQTMKKYANIRASEHYEIMKFHQKAIELWEDAAGKYTASTYEHEFVSKTIQMLKEFVFRFAY